MKVKIIKTNNNSITINAKVGKLYEVEDNRVKLDNEYMYDLSLLIDNKLAEIVKEKDVELFNKI